MPSLATTFPGLSCTNALHQGQSYDLNYDHCEIKLCPHANLIIIIIHNLLLSLSPSFRLPGHWTLSSRTMVSRSSVGAHGNAWTLTTWHQSKQAPSSSVSALKIGSMAAHWSAGLMSLELSPMPSQERASQAHAPPTPSCLVRRWRSTSACHPSMLIRALAIAQAQRATGQVWAHRLLLKEVVP